MEREAEIIREENPWWRSEDAALPNVLPHLRQPAFDRVQRQLFQGDRRRGILVIGLRWVGKTELVKQIASTLRTRDGLPGSQLAYVRVDEPKLRGSLTIDQVLAAWDPVRNKDAPALLVIDEAHRLADPTPDGSWGWSRQLKGVIDQGRIEILATGSDAGRLLEGAGEGAGRWEYVELEPLSFGEFRTLRSPAGGPPLDATRIQDLETYLRVGGFPDFAVHPDPRQALLGIQRYAEGVLLDELGGIRQISKVERAFAILMDTSGQHLDASKLSGAVGVKAATLERWLSALESVRLIQRIPRITRVGRSKLHQLRGQPKVHGTDPGLVAAFSRWSDPLTDVHARGALYEAAVLRHLREVARESDPGAAIFCLQISKSGKNEIDFVLTTGEEVFLVEVTSGASEIEEKAQLLSDVGSDPALCGTGPVYAVVVGASDRSTRAGVPAVDAARFLATVVGSAGEDPLQPLRDLSHVVGGP